MKASMFDRLRSWARTFSAPADKRNAARISFRGGIEVRRASGEILRGVARDLSATGMGAIVFGGDLNPGETVFVKYEHPHPERLQWVGRQAVVKQRFGFRYGFEFAQAMETAATSGAELLSRQ